MTSILERLQQAVQTQGFKVRINELPPYNSGYTVLDVEHDENGSFVGLGCLSPGTDTVWYFSDINKVSFSLGKVIGHNVVTDVELLTYWGIDIAGIHWDTMLMGHLLDSSLKDYSLKGMAKRELGIEYPTYDEIVGKKTAKQKNPRATLDTQPLELVSLYNAMDVWSTYKLYQKQESLINGTI